MKGLGGTLLGLGFLVVLIALNLTTTMHTEVPSSVLSGRTIPSEVSNLGLLQRQMIWLQIGLASVVSGAVFLAAGLVTDAILLPRPQAEADAAATESPPPPGETRVADRVGRPEEMPASIDQFPAAQEAGSGNEGIYWLGGAAVVILLIVVFLAASQPTSNVNSVSGLNQSVDDALMGNDVTAVDGTMGNDVTATDDALMSNDVTAVDAQAAPSAEPELRSPPPKKQVAQDEATMDNDVDAADLNDTGGE